jgi:alkylhydroperoxidase family enzyme
MLSHGAVASRHLGKSFVEPILVADWRSLELAPRLAGVLRFLELLTLRPAELGDEHLRAAIDTGATREDLEQVAAVCSSFSFMNRFVDVFGADLPAESVDRIALVLDKGFGLIVASNRGKPWRRLAADLSAAKQRTLESFRHGPGDAPAELREAIEARVAAASGATRPVAAPLPGEVERFVDTITRDGHEVGDEHFAALIGAGWSEPAIYEIIFVACAAAGFARLERAWARLR